MARTGRPRAEINQTEFEKLCAMQCTEDEVLAWFNINESTLNRWCKRTYKETFAEVFRKKKEGGKISLRRRQWHLAEKSATMAIFLGKNYLGQRDERQIAVENIDNTVKELGDIIAGLDIDDDI